MFAEVVKSNYIMWLKYMAGIFFLNVIAVIILMGTVGEFGYGRESKMIGYLFPLDVVVAVFITFKSRSWMSQIVNNKLLKFVSMTFLLFGTMYFSLLAGGASISLLMNIFN